MDALIEHYVRKTLTEHGYGELDGLYWETGDHPFDDIAVFGSLSTQALVNIAYSSELFDEQEKWGLGQIIQAHHLQLDSWRKDKFNVQWKIANAPVFNAKEKQLITWLVKEIERELGHLKNQMYQVIRLMMKACPKQKVVVDKQTQNLNVVVSISYEDDDKAYIGDLENDVLDEMVKGAIMGNLLYGTVTIDVYQKSDMVNIYRLTEGGGAIYQTPNGNYSGLTEIVRNMITADRPFFELPKPAKTTVTIAEPTNSGWLNSLLPAC